MNTPGNRHQPNSFPKRKRKNNPILIAILLLMVTALALSALSNRGGRVPSPSRSAGNASLPATPRTASRHDTTRGVFADGTDTGARTPQVPASPPADRDRIEKRPVTDTVVSLDQEAPDVVSTTAPVRSSSNLEVDLSSSPLGPMRAPRVPTTAMVPGQRRNNGDSGQEISNQQDLLSQNRRHDDDKSRKPREDRLIKAHSFNGDLRNLPYRRPVARERRELEEPEFDRTFAPGTTGTPSVPEIGPVAPPAASAPAPAPTNVFEGLDRFTWGAGSPPDTNGDVGPTYYIQTVNTSIGIFRKSDGFQEAAFTFDTFMSQGNFGNLCDTNNFGDPVVLYDTFEDRWIITDFAFLVDGGGNPLTPAFQCVAASQSGNPLTGGWNFYSKQISDNLNDYPKFGIWPDGLYMSANMFGFGAGGTFAGARAFAFNKAQMYAGSPTVKIVSFDIGGGDFTVIPSNARLQTGTPPAGRPNLFLSTWLFTNALTVYKFHVDWNSISLSTFTGPDTPVAATSWPNAAVANAPQPGTATLLDVLQIRAMVQSQYTNFGGTESLWVPHTVRRANTTGFAAPRWYQLNVTGGTVAANIPQAATWDPDGANVIHRFMPSLALDRAGNMAMGYSTSNGTTEFPSMKYAGRLAGDPVNTFSQTEQTFFTGTASQTGSSRWGDYSAMTLDPNGCTFWYTTEYANPADQTIDHRWLTKFGSIGNFPGCTPVGAGTVTGTVTVTPGGTPISGATVSLGARTATTDGSGIYSFINIPAGTYPSISATKPGFSTVSAASISVTDGGTTTQDFALSVAPASACLTDTTQADFLTGVFTNVDLDISPGDVKLRNLAVDQQNTAGTTTGTGFGTPAWTGQTFIPAVTGQLVKAEIELFCNGCGATPPNLTLSVRSTSAGLPTGADLASVTIPGSTFGSGATTTFTASFGAPATLTSGTQYALILRPVSVPAGSGYFWIRSSPSTYASGSRVLSADSGVVWNTDTTRDYNFKAYMLGPYNPTSGNLVSGVKDSNPAAGLTPIWSTLSWNGATPANTSLQFQVAGSNDVNGPFNFVGPDGTAGTFFTTSPASLSQFYNLRYLEYKAFLATTNSAVTPTLNDVTLCFNDVDCNGTPTITPTPAQVCANSTGNTASGPAGQTSYSWSITNGTITSATNIQSITYTAGATGNVGLMLNVVAPSGCQQSNSVNVPINPIPATPTITPGGPTTFCTGGSVTLTSSSASGNQWYLDGNPIGGATNSTYNATAQGSYTVVVTTSGCVSAASAATVVTVNPIPPTPTITPGGPTTFGAGGSVTLTSSSASGNQWYLNGNPIGGEINQNYVATASGDYTVVVTASGCSSAPSAVTTVTVCQTATTVTNTNDSGTGSLRQAISDLCVGGTVTFSNTTAGGATNFFDGSPHTITLTSGELAIGQNLTITGPGANFLTISGNNTFRLLNMSTAGVNLTISSLAFTGGKASGGQNAAALEFDLGGTLTLNDCEFYNNTDGSSLATLYSNGAGTITLNRTTFRDNTTLHTIEVDVTAFNLFNSTISNNAGVGIYNRGNSLTATNSTIANNLGSGIWNVSTLHAVAATLGNTLLSNNGGLNLRKLGANPNTFTSSGHNLIDDSTGSELTAPGAGDLLGASAQTLLAPLAYLGGTTQTRALLPGSAALDAGDNTLATNSGLTTDQRGTGFNRIVNGTVDIGAFESRGFTIAATSGTPQSAPFSTAFGSPLLATVSNAFGEPVNGGQVTFTAPGAGASATFTNSLNTINVTTNATGQAGASVTANATVGGPYNVVANGNGITGTANFSLTNTKANQTITFGGLANKTFGDADFGVSATASSLLPVTFTASGNCSVSTSTVHLTGAGSCTITAKQAGDTNYNPAPDVPQSFTIAKANQTITFGALGNKTFGDADFGVSATATSTLAVSFTASGNCTVTAGTVHITGAGSCTITAKQAGDTNYNPAPDAPQSLTIAKANQTITFGALGNKTFGDADFGVSATASSTLAVSFTASGNCTVTGSTVHITGAGSCTITAKQAGDTNYNPAPDVPQIFSIAKANQTINFGALGNKAFADADFGVSATATSSLAVSFTATGNCTVTGSTVHITGVGSCTITAKQAGDTNYNPAPDVPQSFSIAKANQTINFAALGNKMFGDADFGVSATATSSLAVSFTASGNCTITGSTVHITGAGSCTITAKQAGDTNYNSAPDVPQSFNVAQANTTIGLTSSLNPLNLPGSVTFTATIAGPASSGTPTGTVQFKDNGSAITCANAGGQTLNASGIATCQTSSLTAGTHTITADYNGDANFLSNTGTLSGGQVVNSQALLSFSQASQSVSEATGFITITVNRTGDLSVPVTVDYATDDTGAPMQCAPVGGNTLASSRCDFGLTLGTLRFAASETQKSFTIPVTQDAFTEGPENFTVSLSNPTGGAALTLPPTATVTINDSTSATPNAIDDTETFVRQQYRDFLNREADPSGLAFWKNNIDKCNDPAQRPPAQTVAQCIEVQRILTSAAFFLSIEFKGTGGLVRDFYVAALDRPLTNNMPNFIEFMRDTEAIQKGVIVGQSNWPQVLEANQLAFMNEFVTRAEFVALYPTTDTPTQYVDKLYQHAKVIGTQQERLDAIADFGGAATAADTGARARALLRVTRSGDFQAREANRTFVQIEYFGYLRRNPNDPPDNNFDGFNFWVNKMNQFQGDFLQAEMVKAFLSSLEYRKRFGP